jgi:hypothetical protein
MWAAKPPRAADERCRAVAVRIVHVLSSMSRATQLERVGDRESLRSRLVGNVPDCSWCVSGRSASCQRTSDRRGGEPAVPRALEQVHSPGRTASRREGGDHPRREESGSSFRCGSRERAGQLSDEETIAVALGSPRSTGAGHCRSTATSKLKRARTVDAAGSRRPRAHVRGSGTRSCRDPSPGRSGGLDALERGAGECHRLPGLCPSSPRRSLSAKVRTCLRRQLNSH